MNVMQETQKIAAVVLFKDLHAKKWTYMMFWRLLLVTLSSKRG